MNQQKPIDLSSAKVLQALGSSKIVAEAVAAADAKLATRRELLARDMAKLERDAERDFPKLNAAVETVAQEQRDAEAALWKIKLNGDAALSARSAASFTFTREHSALERELIATAAPEITDFITEIWAQLQNPPTPTLGYDVVKNPITGKREELRSSNVAAIYNRLTALRAAAEKAEAMRLEPDQSNIVERLAHLRSTLPGIN